MIIYTTPSGSRVVEINISTVDNWYKPYIGWVGNENNQTLTISTRASFDAGATWTSSVINSNQDELTDAFNETEEKHADIIEISQSLSTDDNIESPWIDQIFIYFPDFNPYIESTFPTITCSIDCYLHAYMDQISFPFLTLAMTRDMTEYNQEVDLDCAFSFSFESSSGALFLSSLPEIDLEINGSCQTVGVFKGNIPEFSLNLSSGGVLVDTIPKITLQISSQTNYLSTIDLNLQFLMCNINSFPVSEGNFIFTLPRINYQANITQGIIAELVMQAQKLFMDSNGYVGAIGAMQANLNPLQGKITSHLVSLNDFDSFLPEFIIQINADKINFDILRYTDWRIR